VADVRRVARKYLKPDNLTIAIFGSLTEEDVKTLDERFGVTVLDKDEVFSGGFDVPVEPGEDAPGE
jgi:predicted Zn-dependent peptidase